LGILDDGLVMQLSTNPDERHPRQPVGPFSTARRKLLDQLAKYWREFLMQALALTACR
jgi:hypothetical protein